MTLDMELLTMDSRSLPEVCTMDIQCSSEYGATYGISGIKGGKQNITRYLDRDDKIYVFRLGEETVGYMHLTRVSGEEFCREMTYVKPEFRRRGLASSMIDMVSDVMRKSGIKKLSGYIDMENLSSIKLFEGKGALVENAEWDESLKVTLVL